MLCTCVCLSFVNTAPVLSFSIQIKVSQSKWVWGFSKSLVSCPSEKHVIGEAFGVGHKHPPNRVLGFDSAFVLVCFFPLYEQLALLFTLSLTQYESVYWFQTSNQKRWGKAHYLWSKLISKSECNLCLLPPTSFVSAFGWVLLPLLLISREYFLHKFSILKTLKHE